MYTKAVISGSQIELYQFEKVPLNLGRKTPTNRKNQRFKSQYSALFRTKANAFRSKKHFERIVYVALADRGRPYFCTFTMLSTCSIKKAYKEFTRFSYALKRKYPGSGYIAVPEFQQRGAVHFHALFWGIDELAKKERSNRSLQNIWGLGYVDCRPTDGSPKLAKYLSKYMLKGLFDYRLLRQKAYCRSQNMLSPVSITTETPGTLSIALENLGYDHTIKDGKVNIVDIAPNYTREFDTMWLGRATYSKFSLEN